jgi:hypothetical protein
MQSHKVNVAVKLKDDSKRDDFEVWCRKNISRYKLPKQFEYMA